jgi:hypothetical protein
VLIQVQSSELIKNKNYSHNYTTYCVASCNQ